MLLVGFPVFCGRILGIFHGHLIERSALDDLVPDHDRLVVSCHGILGRGIRFQFEVNMAGTQIPFFPVVCFRDQPGQRSFIRKIWLRQLITVAIQLILETGDRIKAKFFSLFYLQFKIDKEIKVLLK